MQHLQNMYIHVSTVEPSFIGSMILRGVETYFTELHVNQVKSLPVNCSL